MALTFEEVPYDAPDAEALRADQALEVLDRYGEEEDEDAIDVAVWLLVRDGSGRAVGGGGVTPPDGGVSELAGLFVRAFARSAGVGRLLLGELEVRARAAGATRLAAAVLPRQPEAAELLAVAGYERVADDRFERDLS